MLEDQLLLVRPLRASDLCLIIRDSPFDVPCLCHNRSIRLLFPDNLGTELLMSVLEPLGHLLLVSQWLLMVLVSGVSYMAIGLHLA